MISFKVVERVLGVGPRKGQKAYGAEPKSINKFSQAWLVERIVRETSLSEGDVRNVLITLVPAGICSLRDLRQARSGWDRASVCSHPATPRKM